MRPPICARSGKRTATSSSSPRRDVREHGGHDAAHAAQHAPETEARDRVRLGPVDEAVTRAAHRRVGRERRARVRRRDHEVDLLERGGHHPVGAHAEVLGDRGGAQVVERLRQIQADRDLVGEIGRACRPAVAQLREQGRQVAHHPLHGEVRQVELDVDLDHAGWPRSAPWPKHALVLRLPARR